MADTNPSKSGFQTSEFVATIVSVVTIAAACVAGLGVTFGQLHQSFPDVAWVGSVLGLLGTVGSVAATVMKYIGSRTDVKVAMLQQGTMQQALTADLQAKAAAIQGATPRP